jgi:serine/threonine protein phosphatase PrpC
LKLTHATLSRVGGRKVNEDASGNLTLAARQGCWVIADGLGGHGGGDVASRIVVDTIINAYRTKPEFSSAHLSKMLEFTQYALLAQQEDNYRLSAMRSTVVVLLLEEDKAWWAHVGDSRLYHFSSERIVFQTKDHSVPQVMVDAGDIAYKDIRHHEDRNRLTRSLGNEGKVRSTVLAKPVAISEGDVFLMCTDGFWEFVTEANMETTLAQSASPENWLAAMEAILLHRAPASHDNYTATAIFVDGAKISDETA